MTRRTLVITLALFASALYLESRRLAIKPWPPKSFPDAEMHFKYGSIGAEVNGFPYQIWRELPEIFADRIPHGFAEFGFISEPNQELPVGVSVRRYGVKRVGFNCATCHTSSVTYGDTTRIVLGAPAERLDLQAYIRFLSNVSTDPRLTYASVVESAREHGRSIGVVDKLILKHIVFPRLAAELAKVAESMQWMNTRALHGPGRTDAGNVWRSRWHLSPERDSAVATVDFPSVWNQHDRLRGSFHWDGNNSSLDERNISAALAGGTAEWLLDHNSLRRVSDWLLDLRPPPFPVMLDAGLVATGKTIYNRERCSGCHDVGASNTGKVTPLAIVGTDPERVNLFSADVLRNFASVGAKYSWQFHNYQKTDGYVNAPLDGIWMRGPYLHNGSVPTLSALLSPAADRPVRFYRGCTKLDPIAIGFTCTQGFEFDTRLRGNSNAGHEYGTSLSPTEKAALLEYLKSL